MAAVSVTADNNRVNAADAVTGWGNDGGGGGVANEVDIVYQNGISQSRKISTSRIGRNYTHTGTVDMTATNRRHYLCKITVTNPGVLLSRTPAGTGPALGVKIGSDASNYDEIYVAGAENYPARGGWLLFPISVNVSGYRDNPVGSSVRTGVQYWSVLADFLSGSKAENVAIDAIDVGAGLHLVGGDGADPDGTFTDFVDFDEGTIGNRYGYVFTQGALVLVNGRLAIGRDTSSTAVATEFVDTGGTVVAWQNGYAETGFHRCLIDLGSASTAVTISNGTFLSEGENNNTLGLGYSTTEDTRAVLEVVGTAGTFDLTAQKVSNFSDVILTSACTLDGCDIQTASLTQGSADIAGGTKIRTTSASGVATIADPTFGVSSGINNVDFIQEGAGHALELSTVGATVTLTDITFSSYGADTTNSAAIYVSAASGTTTINWSGGTAPTVRTAGATVNVVNSVTVKVTAKDAADSSSITGARVYLEADAGGPLPAADVVTITRSGSTATVSHTTHGLSTGDVVKIRGADQSEYNQKATITVTGASSYTYTVSGTPATPATGTITSTAVILDDVTDGSGVVQDTGFAFASNQPVTGRIRKNTSSPRFKTSPVSGTITTAGFDSTTFLVGDE